jgi:hypothetical protein
VGGTTARVDRVVEAVAPLAPLPRGARLLHVALPGTGGSGVQRAMHASRAALREHHVGYAGRAEQLIEPVLAATGRPNPLTGRVPPITAWRAVVHAAAEAGDDRLALSSELLADAPSEAIHSIVDDLDRDRVHVLVSLVSLARILPDAWARAVEWGSERTYDEWLRAVLDGSADPAWETFWSRHRQDRLVDRWAGAIGRGNVTIVVADDRLTVAAAIARLTDLTLGSLGSVPSPPVDRALTSAELEVVRAFNERFAAERLDATLHATVVRFGAVPYLKTRSPAANEGAVRTPAWALERAREAAVQTTDAIRASGVRCVGDLEALRRADDVPNDHARRATITPAIAASAAMGVLLSTGLVRGAAERVPRPIDTPESFVRDPDPYIPRPRVEALALARMTTPAIAEVVARRTITAGSHVRRSRGDGTTGGRPNPILLPPGTRLLHVEPFVTGTTTVQGAFRARRHEVRSQGVHYVGPTLQPMHPALAVTGRSQVIDGSRPPASKAWRALLSEIRRAREPRTVISSGFFSDAGTEAIQRITTDLDPARVQVVVAIRPLVLILASQWQQWVQSGTRMAYRDWLRAVFETPTEGQGARFWRRHRHDELVARWAVVAGPENVTVVAFDDSDPTTVLRVFEDLTGLETGTLTTPPDRSNRSLTHAEAEVVRAFNELGATDGVPGPTMAKTMRYGGSTYMKQRQPDRFERRIETPAWAIARARDVEREMVDAIEASGVRIVGALERLVDVDASPARDDAVDALDLAEVLVPSEAAARAAIGVLLASGLARGATAASREHADDQAEDARPTGVDDLETMQIAGVLARRLEASARRPVDRLRRAARPTRS